MKVGVVAVQGAVAEHVSALEAAFSSLGVVGEAYWLVTERDLERADGVVLPGGESTTISKLLTKNRLRDRLAERARSGMPVMGTCAGCVLLASEGDAQVQRTGTELLGLMEMGVQRNAFGGQRESFETDLQVSGLEEPFHAVFIRAPAITRVWGECRALAELEGRVVLARQGRMTAVTFHPELAGDTRVHELFLKDVLEYLASTT